MEGLSMRFSELADFYRGKRVLITGHTGFKGSWLSLILKQMGAEVYGYALEPPTDPALFEILDLRKDLVSEIGDIRDFEHLRAFSEKVRPEILFHLAAQPIVRASYEDPRGTFETNVMGTVNVLETVRMLKASGNAPLSVLNVTTDKVYENHEDPYHAFTEDEKLDGFDPYSNSKSCSELVTHSYIRSFFQEGFPAVSTARAGNVIGGGDFARDRIIPDCVRDTMNSRPIRVRNPLSTRPYQHVLEPLFVYLLIAAAQAGADGACLRGFYNVGPDEADAITTGELADLFTKNWPGASWQDRSESGAVHEAAYLRLDTGKLKRAFGRSPVWHVREAVAETVKWYRAYADGQDMREFSEKQIDSFLEAERKNR